MNSPILIQVALDLTTEPKPQLVIFPFKPAAEKGDTTIIWTRVGSIAFEFADLLPANLFHQVQNGGSMLVAHYTNNLPGDHNYSLSVSYGGTTYPAGPDIGSASGPTIKNR